MTDLEINNLVQNYKDLFCDLVNSKNIEETDKAQINALFIKIIDIIENFNKIEQNLSPRKK